MVKLDDKSKMPFGEHKGKEMQHVPDGWLLWLWGENKASFQFIQGRQLMSKDVVAVMEYIEDSFTEKELA